jgi:hypothetical protein
MKARVIIQRLPTGQVNICFTQDPTADPEDFLVSDPRECDVLVGEVLILSDEPAVAEALLDKELRSVDNIEEIDPVSDYIKGGRA